MFYIDFYNTFYTVCITALAVGGVGGCTLPTPHAVEVYCDAPVTCSSADAVAAFETGSHVPGTQLTVHHLAESGEVNTAEICTPTSYNGSGMQGRQRLLDAARTLLDDPSGTVPDEFACPAATVRDVPQLFFVGPGAGDIETHSRGAGTAPRDRLVLAAICDRSGSNAISPCDLDVVAGTFEQTTIRTGLPPAHWLVVDSRGSYGDTEFLYDAAIDAPTEFHRLGRTRLAAAEIRGASRPLPAGGSALIDALARAGRRMEQLGQRDTVVFVFGDGREISPGVNVERDRVSSVLPRLRRYASETLPANALSGATVIWVGLHARDLTAPEHRELTEAWRQILVDAGAESVTFHDVLPPEHAVGAGNR